jgi:type II secretory pathway pseudopilin PulG
MIVSINKIFRLALCIIRMALLKTRDARRKTPARAVWRARGAKGLTIIELVTVIVVLGLAIPPLLTSWANIAWRSVRSESLADATFYAQALMEEIKSKRFDENTSSPWTSPLGPEPGESRAGIGASAYDDVDDFNGCSDSPATRYNRSATVDYAALSGTTWQNSGSITNFKRIAVTVSRSDGLAKDVNLVTIVAAY